jgi:hypothetical protein
MILAGMVFGDIFAVFVLHQNAARVGASLAAAAQSAQAGAAAAVAVHFKSAGEFLENRGTKVDAHVHLTAFGYLALILALVQPYVGFSEAIRRRLAWLFVFGGVLLPVGVFLIHYVGLAYSPLQAIGWPVLWWGSGSTFARNSRQRRTGYCVIEARRHSGCLREASRLFSPASSTVRTTRVLTSPVMKLQTTPSSRR